MLRFLLPGVCAAALLASASPVFAQSPTDAVEVLRSALKADRKVLLAEAMQFTASESDDFWPVYREYRAELDKIGDGLIKLVLEYADQYPGPLDEKRAAEMLKEFTGLEEKWVALKTKYSKRLKKVLPPSKVLRFLQVENRLDMVLRLQLASAIPLVPNASSTQPR